MAAAGSGRRSRFAVTCALLRQYMREKENQRQVQMGNLVRLFQQEPPPPPVAHGENDDDDRTMQLFPERGAMSQPAPESPELKKTPMTIFYGGQVVVFDNFPADKAKELMEMAQSATAPPPPEKAEGAEPAARRRTDQQPTIARKASLQRFLKKRKQRISSSTDPDHNEDSSPAKKMDAASSKPLEDVPDASWLSL